MTRIARMIPDADRREAARLVESWGYPRRVWEHEIQHATWITDEPQTGIAWLEVGQCPGDLILHCQSAPKCGHLALSQWTWDTIRCVAGLLGARRLYAPVPPDLADGARLLRYLRRRGWTPTEEPLPGVYLDLGGT